MKIAGELFTFGGGTNNLGRIPLSRICISVARWIFLAICMIFALPVSAQEVLPFAPTPSASTPGLTMKDSICKNRVDAKHLPANAPNHHDQDRVSEKTGSDCRSPLDDARPSPD